MCMYHDCPMQTSPHRHFDLTVRLRNPRPGYRSRSALEVLTGETLRDPTFIQRSFLGL